MAGLLDATAVMGERLAGIGLHHWDTSLGSLRGHVFHYGRLEAVYQQGRLTASFFHGYFGSAPEVVAGLLARG
jgi:cobyrinic acid a,c-diamide synthase